MDTKGILRITGIVGFIVAAVTAYVYIAYILVPVITPILTHQIETQLSNEGISISQSEVSGAVSFITAIMPITTVIGLLIGWLIESAVLWALLRAFRINAGFADTWLLSGNYLYLNVIQTAVIVETPLFNYAVNAVITHRTIPSEPVSMAIGLAFAVLGSLLLAYIFARVYGTNMRRALIPTLIALIIFWAISAVV